jgi:lipoyl(octanoyl) transferase
VSALQPIEVRRLGRTSYSECYELQKELVESRANDAIGDVLVLTEHEPVITVGRGTSLAAVPDPGVPVVEVERGGEATYHGPGQLVAYPILKLPDGRRDLHRYLRDLEEVAIGVLGEFEVVGERRPGMTGVWVGAKKICSIGVAVRRWVTYHGLALNLHVDLAPFRRFRPCGLDPDVMTRLADLVPLPPTNLLGEVLFVKHFCRVFERELPPPPPAGSPSGAGSGYRPLPLL